MTHETMTARDYAIQMHGDQTYGVDKPFVFHLDAVVDVLREYKHTESPCLNGAYLHDVLEDCTDGTPEGKAIRKAEIKAKFGNATLYIVDFCTDEPGANRKERKAATYKKMRDIINLYPIQDNYFGIYAVWVKLADRLANVRQSTKDGHLLGMYRKEAADFREALYVAGLCDNMWAEYDRLLPPKE